MVIYMYSLCIHVTGVFILYLLLFVPFITFGQQFPYRYRVNTQLVNMFILDQYHLSRVNRHFYSFNNIL